MRRLVTATVITLILASGALVPSAAADEARGQLVAEGNNATCFAPPYPLAASPGLTLVPTDQTFGTPQPAVVNCQGSMQGRQVTGMSKILIKGTAAGATCAHARGRGQSVLTVPTAEGPLEIVNNFTFEAAPVGGIFTGDVMSGVFTFSPPTKGDCVTEPLTVVTVTFIEVTNG